MPLYTPPKKGIIEFVLIEGDIALTSGTVRYFPDAELAVDASIEIPVDAGMEIL